MQNNLKILEHEIRSGIYEFGKELWSGAGVIVMFPDNNRVSGYRNNGDIVVQSKHADKISSVIFGLARVSQLR